MSWPSASSPAAPRPRRRSSVSHLGRIPAVPTRRLREENPGNGRVAYTLKSLPSDERPRERLLERGPGSLSDAELLAIILRTGLVGEMVTELATDLLGQNGGFWGLAAKSVAELSRRKGLKGAK